MFTVSHSAAGCRNGESVCRPFHGDNVKMYPCNVPVITQVVFFML